MSGFFQTYAPLKVGAIGRVHPYLVPRRAANAVHGRGALRSCGSPRRGASRLSSTRTVGWRLGSSETWRKWVWANTRLFNVHTSM